MDNLLNVSMVSQPHGQFITKKGSVFNRQFVKNTVCAFRMSVCLAHITPYQTKKVDQIISSFELT